MANVLITGARRGIGIDVARRLAARGHRVYATVHSVASIAPTLAALGPQTGRVLVEKLDILDAQDRAHAAGWEIDVLINNAAVGESGPLLEIDLDRVRRVFETNVYATLALTQGVVRSMIERNRSKQRGRVIFVGSMAGLIPAPFLAPYAATKFALEGLAFALRAELRPFGISVSMINAGAYDTGFNQENVERKYHWLGADSLYRDHLQSIHKAERDVVLKYQVANTASIARKIVHAADARWPCRRYAAPWWQWMGVPLMRALG